MAFLQAEFVLLVNSALRPDALRLVSEELGLAVDLVSDPGEEVLFAQVQDLVRGGPGVDERARLAATWLVQCAFTAPEGSALAVLRRLHRWLDDELDLGAVPAAAVARSLANAEIRFGALHRVVPLREDTTEALEAEGALNDLAGTLRVLSLGLWRLGRLDEAGSVLERARTAAETAGAVMVQGECAPLEGLLRYTTGALDEAVRSFSHSAQLWSRISGFPATRQALINAGLVRSALCELEALLVRGRASMVLGDVAGARADHARAVPRMASMGLMPGAPSARAARALDEALVALGG